MQSSLCFVLFAFVNCVFGDTYKTVHTQNGAIRGMRKYTLFRNVSYYSYLGIPYAEKPLDNLRFKAPVPITSWKPKVIDAFQYGNSCIQQSAAIGFWGPQSEDCLYLNVFVPAHIKPHKKLPVIFFIHGGGYSEGSGNDFFFGPDFLTEKDVIVVTINYRLGALGFMSLNSKQYSGNMGLKDQLMALKWTYRNIHAFHGDKRRITLMGQSAGAVSVHYHVLIAQSRKFIRGAICLSGAAFLRYAYLDQRSHLHKMYHFAQQLNSSVNHFHALVDFLQHVPVQAIVNLTSQTTFDRTLIFDWAPVIEKKTAVKPMLVKTPDEIYQSHPDVNVDMMFSYTNYECLSLAWADVSNSTRLNEFLRDFNLVLPVHELEPQFNSKPYRKLLDNVYHKYFGNVSSEHDKAVQMVNLISDLNMVAPIDRAVKTQAKHSKRRTFYYQFSVDGKLDYIKRTLNIKWPGASHGDDLCFIFRCHSIDSAYLDVLNTMETDEDSQISYHAIENMTTMIANFAKFGEPSVDDEPVEGFKPVRGCKVNFLDITNYALTPGQAPKKEATKFWSRILQKAETLVR